MTTVSIHPKCLITGVGGFVGSHLAEMLLAQGADITGTYHASSGLAEGLAARLTLLPCDFQSRERVGAVVRAQKWDCVFHLAAQSFPAPSWTDPETTFRTNLLGTLFLLDAVRSAALRPRILLAGSSAEYAGSGPDGPLIGEDAPLTGSSPYGVSKVAAELLADLYVRSYGLEVVTVRPFFVIGPGKKGDVASDFARRIVAIENGESDVLEVGNIEAVRDFLDVRDAVRACWLLAERGRPGEAYNICSGVGTKVSDLLDILCSRARRPVEVRTDPGRLRPLDAPRVVGDNSRLRALGWKPEVTLEESLAGILAYWRGARRD